MSEHPKDEKWEWGVDVYWKDGISPLCTCEECNCDIPGHIRHINPTCPVHGSEKDNPPKEYK
jgi:hypothetical protein